MKFYWFLTFLVAGGALVKYLRWDECRTIPDSAAYCAQQSTSDATIWVEGVAALGVFWLLCWLLWSVAGPWVHKRLKVPTDRRPP